MAARAKPATLLGNCSPAFSLYIYLIVSCLMIAAYILVSGRWVAIGGTGTQFFRELPFILPILLIAYFPKLKRRIAPYPLPAVSILLLYVLFDLYYNAMQRPPRPADFAELPALFHVSPWLGAASAVLWCAIVLPFLIVSYHAYRVYGKAAWRRTMLIRLTVVVVICLLIPTDAFAKLHGLVYDYKNWSQEVSVRLSGRISSFVYYGNQDRVNRRWIQNNMREQVDVSQALYPGSAAKPRNIHIVVLESFIDPRLIEYGRYDKSPLAPGLLPFLTGSGKFSHVTSPVYSGGSAQAEFELLTGVAALAKVGGVEFNVMKGSAAASFVNRLKESDYRTIATVAARDNYYNVREAYRSLGFEDVTFMLLADNYRKPPGDYYVFDGDTFDYNLRHIKPYVQAEQPVLNYVVGMFGHYPFFENQLRRPDLITTKHPNGNVRKIANQFYYRTEALARYLQELTEMDPDGLIYITSDHIPLLINEHTNYALDRYENSALLLVGGTPTDVSGKKYYEIPWLFWDIITGTEHSRAPSEKDMENLYFQILAESTAQVPN